MDGNASNRAALRFVSLIALLGALLSLGGGTALAADSGNSAVAGAALQTTLKFNVCFVVDTDNFSDFSFSSLAAVVAGAAPGDKLVVLGTCAGSTTIGEDLTIEGVRSFIFGTPTLQGSSGLQAGGVLTIGNGAVVAIDGLTITGGATTVQGGGIDNHGTLTLTNSIVRSNSSGQVGGGIINYGTLTLDNSGVLDNVAGNGTTSGDGGGIQNQGSVTLNNGSDIEGNSASFGGGVESGVFGQTTTTLTLNDFSRIDGNSAHQGGGVLNAADGAGVSATVTLNGTSSIDGNTADTTFGGYGAGIFNEANSGGSAAVTLNDSSSIAGNTAHAAAGNGGLGGGILDGASAGSTATVYCPSASAAITQNSADINGGGIFESGGTADPNCATIVTANTPNNIG